MTIKIRRETSNETFYKTIENIRNQGLSSNERTTTSLIGHIVKAGQMRDAQIEAMKRYPFLKMAWEGKPLATLFKNGVSIRLAGTC